MTHLLSQPTTVILTGGTAGIGQAICRRLLEAGHDVVVMARSAAAMPRSPRLHPVACDLSDPVALRAAVNAVARRHPDLSLVINNAAVQYDKALADPELDLDRIEDEVRITLLAPAILVNGLLPTMLANRRPGAIVNVNSGLAIFPKRRTALYCATKAALHSLSESLRHQLEGTNVGVIEAFLPLVDTAMTAGRGRDKISAETAADRIMAGIARDRPRIWVGRAAAIPLMARLAPSLGRLALRGPR